jgi:phosphinothricin acetyltransferase
MTTLTLRDATKADLPAITAIHNSTIDDTTTTWSDEPETLEHRATWFADRMAAGDPVLVAEDDGEVVGFTGWAWFRGEGKWPGYRHTRELSIHIREDHRGDGIGRFLIDALVTRAAAEGIHVLVAGVDSGNEGSIRFHRRMGFVEVARMAEVGRKFDRWLDLVLLQRILQS